MQNFLTLFIVLCCSVQLTAQNTVVQKDSISVYEGRIPDSVGRLDEKPEFPGGLLALSKFINDNYHFPDEDGMIGRPWIEFTIEKNGTLSNMKVLRDNTGVAGEIIRVMGLSPKWKPAKQNGKYISIPYYLGLYVSTADSHRIIRDPITTVIVRKK